MSLEELMDIQVQEVQEEVHSDYDGRELYSVAKNGKIQMWKADVLTQPDEKGWYTIRATFGFTDGAKQTKDTHVKKGTNIGKKNEKSVFEQAYVKLEQMYEDKMKKNSMVWDVKDFVAPKRPMLASPWKKRAKHLTKVRGWLVDRKLDGNRAYTYPDSSVQSKSGEPITPFKHLVEDFKSQSHKHELFSRLELDGEYYIHGVDLVDLTGAISKEKDEERPTDILLEYHVYDCFDPERPNLTALERWEILQEIFGACEFKFHKLCEKVYVDNDVDALTEISRRFLEEGYEGGMLRDIDGIYMHSKNSTDRNDVLIKFKFMEDDEFFIIGCTENENEPGTPKWIVDLRNGNTNEVVMSGKKEHARKLYDDRELYVNKAWLKTQYQNYTKYGKLSFAVGLEIRIGTLTEHGFEPKY